MVIEDQHGFRSQRSTMSALTAMQKNWIRNSEDGLMTGLLIWDLSAAFDTVNTNLLVMKLKIYCISLRKLSILFFPKRILNLDLWDPKLVCY